MTALIIVSLLSLCLLIAGIILFVRLRSAKAEMAAKEEGFVALSQAKQISFDEAMAMKDASNADRKSVV